MLGNEYLNSDSNGLGLFWKVKSLFCGVLGHNYELQRVSDVGDGVSYCVYVCKNCGSMSFSMV